MNERMKDANGIMNRLMNRKLKTNVVFSSGIKGMLIIGLMNYRNARANYVKSNQSKLTRFV